jgi:Skp family chaperone for outer membrane proteins
MDSKLIITNQRPALSYIPRPIGRAGTPLPAAFARVCPCGQGGSKMRKTAVVLGSMVIGLFLFAGSAQAADKFGYIDLSRTFSEYNKTKGYDKTLNDKEKAYTDERDKKVAELKALQDKFNLLNDKEREAKKGELETKMKAFQDSDRLKQEELRKEQDEKMKEILKDIEDAVKKYSEKEGYTMVFNDRVLVYQNKALEITNKIIEALNKNGK